MLIIARAGGGGGYSTSVECWFSITPPATRLRVVALTVCAEVALDQGQTLAHLRAQCDNLQDASLTLELNSSTFGTRRQINLDYMGEKVS
jgi:hypothetical protein